MPPTGLTKWSAAHRKALTMSTSSRASKPNLAGDRVKLASPPREAGGLRLRFTGIAGGCRFGRRLVSAIILVWLLVPAVPAPAADAPPIPPAPHQSAAATPAPAGDMSSAGW